MKKKLKDICTLEKGKQIDTKSLDDFQPYRYINGGIKESGFYNDYNTEGETVLISEGGASCGYVNYVNEKFWCGCHCYRLTNISVFPKYLFYSLKASQIGLMGLRTGAAMPNIKKETLKDFKISICESKEEQQKIAAELDTIQSAIDNKKRQLSLLDEAVKSEFVEMFGENPVESGKWKVETLGEESELITKGASPRWQGIDYQQEGTLFITSENVRNGFIDITKRKCLDEKINELLPRSVLKKNDVLINIVGASIGRAAIFDLDEKANINQAVALVRLKTTAILQKDFLIIYLNSELAMKAYRSMIKGGARDNLSLQNISDLPIPVPPLSLQNQFATFVRQIDTTKTIIKTQLKDLNELLESKMDFYFME